MSTKMMFLILFLCVVFTSESEYLETYQTSYTPECHNTSFTTDTYVANNDSQTTVSSDNQMSQMGDDESLDSLSTSALSQHERSLSEDSEYFASKKDINIFSDTTFKTSPPGMVSTRTIKYPATDMMEMTGTELVTYGSTGRPLEGLEHAGSEGTEVSQQNTASPAQPYIEQTQPAAFRVNINACQASQKTETISASEGVVEVVVANNSTGELSCTWNLAVPYGKFVSIQFDRFHLGKYPLCQDVMIFMLQIFDPGDTYTIVAGCDLGGLLPPVAYSLTNQVFFQFKYDFLPTGLQNTVAIQFRFNTTRQSLRRSLQVVNTSSKSGYVTSPGYDGKRGYPNYCNSYATITPPARHTVMISFPRVDIERSDYCSFDSLKLTKLTTNGETEIWRKCGGENIIPRIFNSSLRLVFVSDMYLVKTGFKMLFSFHPYLETPNEIEAGVFNCSVPYYEAFKDHVNCNLDRECQGGEDELSCPYTNQQCGVSFVDMGGRCYRYVNPKTNVSWNEALSICQEYGELLLTLKTPQEWKDFLKFLDYGKRSAYLYVGLYTSVPTLDLIYQKVLQWVDGNMAYYVQVDQQSSSSTIPMCFMMSSGNRLTLSSFKCTVKRPALVLCQSPKMNVSKETQISPSYPEINYDALPGRIQKVSFVKCSNKQLAVDFLSCAKESKCDAQRYIPFCEIPGKEQLPMFECDDNTQTIPYTLLCDYRSDCVDGSDEKFCVFPACTESMCNNKQCLSSDHRCDGLQHCMDRSDEECEVNIQNTTSTLPPPAIVDLTKGNKFTITPLNASQSCPDTHFRCSDEDYCLPVFMRCNDVYDCAGRQDETNCETYTCPGLYRCYSSSVCLHPSHVCDGVFQCPQQDDERFCQLTCPQDSCTCQGHAFVCSSVFNVSEYPDIRYLDASGSGLTQESVENNVFLVTLILRNCRLRALSNFNLPNLQVLDLGNNLLTSVIMSVFLGLTNLRYLSLAGNPLNSLVRANFGTLLGNLNQIDLSFSYLETYSSEPLKNFPNIKYLNLSNSPIKILVGNAFSATPYIQSLDLKGCPVQSFEEGVLRDLESLLVMYSENYKLCCSATLPQHFDIRNCYTTTDEISSCEDLLQSNVYRIFLWVFCLLALVGNAGSFVSRFCLNNQASYSVFVINLNIADFVMGIYLAIIGVADLVYRGKYLWHDTTWKSSPVCHVAGFLCLLSTEVSAFIICLITLDRFLVLRFPFSRVRFKKHSAALACCSAWMVGLVLAAVPLLPMTSHWDFYSQTGICVPLPITRKSFGGHSYSFGVVIVLNLVLFVLIAVGQLIIYHSVRVNSLSTSSNKNAADLAVARRLTSVVVSSFLCFFPVGFLGLLAAHGTPIPGEVNVAMAIFVLPFNAALNPFLYTFNTVMEKRRRATELRLLKRLESRVHSEVFSLRDAVLVKSTNAGACRELVLKQITVWIEEKVLTPDEVITQVKNSLN